MGEFVTLEDLRPGGIAEAAARTVGSSGERTLPGETPAKVAPLQARLENGRWIVDCPDESCAGAELASSSGLFFCCGCRNAAQGNAPIPSAFPADRSKIEAALVALAPAERVWRPDDLAAVQVIGGSGGLD